MSLQMLDAAVPQNAVAMWWIGQAGFVFKTPRGKIVVVDPYLSDAAERMFGFKRLTLPPITADEVRADLLVLTHEHADHLDPDTVPVIVKNNPACRVIAPKGCIEGLDAAAVPNEAREIVESYKRYAFDDVVIHTARADHGDFSDTALAVVLQFGGIRIACTGDTSFRPNFLKPLYEVRPDVLLPCINGVFGNMGHIDAAMLTQAANPRFAIPCHYWTFAEHGAGDPAGFVNACRCLCPEVKALLLRPGDRFVVSPEEAT